jgi:hypothetical protein
MLMGFVVWCYSLHAFSGVIESTIILFLPVLLVEGNVDISCVSSYLLGIMSGMSVQLSRFGYTEFVWKGNELSRWP